MVANIIARILIELAPSLAKAVRPGGTLILGGIIDVKEAAVRDAFDEVGLMLVRREEREDWVSLVLRKPALSPDRRVDRVLYCQDDCFGVPSQEPDDRDA